MPVSSYELSNEVENREEDLSYIFESIYFEIVEQFHPDKEEYIYIYIYKFSRRGISADKASNFIVGCVVPLKRTRLRGKL